MVQNETLTRKQLYDLVWSNSLISLSKKYNLSDNGLRKTCIRMNIPLPQRGHWAELQHSKKLARFPLPLKYEGEETITLPIRTEDSSNRELDPLKVLVQQLKQDSQLSFDVPDRLSSKDPLILAAKVRLNGKSVFSSYTYKNVIHCASDELDIRVAPKNVSRALRFLDTLINLLRIRGHRVTIKNGSTFALIRGEEIKFLFREKLKKVIVKGKNWDNTEYHPTDILSFRVDGYYGKEWKDGKHRLETCLPEILAKLELISNFWNEHHLKLQKEHEIRVEQERIHNELKKRKEEELTNFQTMLEKAERWHKSENLRKYIAEVERKGTASGEWLNWARQKADWYDPFIEAKDEMLSSIERNILTIMKKLH